MTPARSDKTARTAGPDHAGGAEPVCRLAEIEDPTNLWFVHPVSNRLTPILAALHVPPNAVSLAGMACGVLAGVAYHQVRDLRLVAAGFALMLVWHVLDGVDGQLARLTNTQSPTGKVLDGICDYVTFTAVYAGLALALSRQHGGWVWGVVALAGACHAVQSAIYETQRQDYLFWGWGRASAALADPDAAPPDRPATPPARAAVALHGLYARVQTLAGGVTPATRRRLAAILDAQPERAPAIRLLYRTMFAPSVRRWSVLSANTRTLGLFAFALAGVPLYYFYVEIAGLSAVLLVLLARQEARYRALFRSLEPRVGEAGKVEALPQTPPKARLWNPLLK